MVDIVQQIDKWGIETPDFPCFIGGKEVFSYRELKETSDKIANFICRKNYINGPILVFGENNFRALATFLGCVKAGFHYIPVDRHTPLERQKAILEASDPVAVFSLVDWELPEIPATPFEELLTEEKARTEGTTVSEKENFYTIYTSGTTGVPKGVQISHENLLSFVDWIHQDFDVKQNVRYLSQAPFSFDLSVMSIYPALMSGSTLMGLTREETLNYKTLFETLPTLGLDVWVSTPSFVDICLMDKNFSQGNFPQLTTFLFCGEELTNQTAKALKERFPKAKVWNTYGPTEATVAVSSVEITEEILANNPRLPIGKAKPGMEILIMDKEKCLAPNEIGEIVLAGNSVSKGYYKTEEKTAEVFFSYHGQQAYKTGDAGYIDENGQLFYTGRMDFQVKLNGFRIELQDIESHLNTVSYVKKAVVLPEIKNFKVLRLRAYVQTNAHDFEKDYQLTKAINEELRLLVMEYMIPAKYIYLEEFPLTQNGKVDRKKLEAGGI